MNNLGFGVGFRSQHYRLVTEELPQSVDWFEIVSENFIDTGGRPRRYLEKLLQNYPVVMHGVGLSIAGFDPFDKNYLKGLKELASQTETPLLSDHLCWTAHGGHNSHDLLPVCFSEENLNHICARIQHVQDYLGRRLFLENPSAYVGFAKQDLGEAQFLAELSLRTDCGILLDVNNLFVNQSNLGLDPINYLEILPQASVGQFHLAGHTNRGDVRIDTHDQLVCDEVWELYKLAVKKWPKVPTLIEWDDKVPEFSVLAEECNKARKLHAQALSEDCQAKPLRSEQASALKVSPGPNKIKNFEIHTDFLQMVTNLRGNESTSEKMSLLSSDHPVDREKGLDVYNHAYFLRIKDCLKESFPAIHKICADEGFSDLVALYLNNFKPNQISIKHCACAFPEFLRTSPEANDYGVHAQVLADIANLEWAKEDLFDLVDDQAPLNIDAVAKLSNEDWNSVKFQFIKAMRLVETSCNAGSVLEAVAKDADLKKPESASFYYLVYRTQDRVEVEDLDARRYNALSMLASGKSFLQTCEALASDESHITALAQDLYKCVERGVITALNVSQKIS